MSVWYQGKISYHIQDAKGKVLKISEVYLVNAVSHSDAETRIYEAVVDKIPDFKLSRLTPLRVSEVFIIPDGSEAWYKVKVTFVIFDERSQKEKFTSSSMLINAYSPLDAYNLIAKRLGNDYLITDINLTSILEVVNESND